MPEMIGIKYVDSLYVLQKKKKFNITAIAITTENRKIGSSIYATKDDIIKLYEAYIESIQNNTNSIVTEISSGKFALSRYNIPSKEDGLVPMYSVIIGDFKCRMAPSTYEQFVITLKMAYENMYKKPSFSMRAPRRILPPIKRGKKNKKKGLFE